MSVLKENSENSSTKKQKESKEENLEVVYKEDGECFQTVIERLFIQHIKTGSYLSNKEVSTNDW